jgi:hypothetical protein
MKTFCGNVNVSVSMLAVVILFVCERAVLAEEKPISSKYERMLYDLGAFPVSNLTQKYWNNGHPGQVYSKGERVDVNGWLPPSLVPSYLTDAEKLKYGIPKKPLRYEQYLGMLDIDTYQRTRDPAIFLVMQFAMRSMADNEVKLKKADALRVYEARIGLDYSTWHLYGQLSGDDAMRLLRSDTDKSLFNILPLPHPTETKYVAFLLQQANAEKWPMKSRQDAIELVFNMDGRTYRKPYQAFLLNNAKTADDWWERAHLYGGLIKLHDGESMAAVCNGLTHDPITDCRELILAFLEEQGDSTSALDAILTIANRQDGKHHAVTINRMFWQWSFKLNDYLKWAREQKDLDGRSIKKIDEAREKLRDTRWD